MKPKLLLIENPVSGMTLGRLSAEEMSRILSSQYRVFVSITNAKDEAEATARSFGKDFNIIAVCGGDGTLNEVLRGIMDIDQEHRPALGVIPAGTSNLFADVIGIPQGIEPALEAICYGDLHGMDVAMMGHIPFVTAISFGCFTDTTYATPQTLKNVFGYTAYVIGAVKSLAELRSYRMKVTIGDEECMDDEFLLGAVTNVNSVGNIIKLDTGVVDYADGLFEVVFVRKPENMTEFSSILGQIVTGKFDNELVRFAQTDRLSIKIDEEISWTVDGEYIGDFGNLEISMKHDALKVFVPSESMLDRFSKGMLANAASVGTGGSRS
ncbi:MAG: YegS/Rv2252/BmrU family lipid kinase [Eubacteriaceae bacterium]|nr:YegS/Rv2252/BmrU family lipid kinase [Eubacteriaceae bacterium]